MATILWDWFGMFGKGANGLSNGITQNASIHNVCGGYRAKDMHLFFFYFDLVVFVRTLFFFISFPF